MATNTNDAPINKAPKKSTSLLAYFHKIKEHRELIAALLSGAIILTAWLMTNIIAPSVWVILHIVAFIIGGYAQAKEGITDTIKTKSLNVELLMVIAAIGAASIGYFTEGAILIFIFSLAGALETYTLQKSEREISSLMQLQPEEARVIRNGEELMIPASTIQIDDKILVRASERIPGDGVIIKGSSQIDEGAITGESVPVTKEVGANVYAGTVSLDGSLFISVTKPANETVFQKIIQMVQSAKAEKAPAQLFIEKFEGTYVKVVLLTVVIMMFLPYFIFGWSLTESIYRAIILLVVASPCALVASIMPATLSAISKSAKEGILFKGGIHVEMLSQINAIAFDKTGTLTKGKPEVTDVLTHPKYEQLKIYEIVGAIENESTHPLAKAITAHALEALNQTAFHIEIQDIKTTSGHGLSAMIDGEKWQIGKRTHQSDADPYFEDKAHQYRDEGKTIVYITHRNQIVAIYALKDTIRSEAKRMIATLRNQGIHTIMLTGDHEATAKAVADEIGIDQYVAECLPEEKVTQLKKLKERYGKTAMIGDGINDAPALATANIGIAMGEGTDVALETADMVLMKNNLYKLIHAFSTSKKMNRIIKQNIIFSLSIIGILILSNFFQFIDLPLGVVGHEGSTILVILNGLRLLK